MPKQICGTAPKCHWSFRKAWAFIRDCRRLKSPRRAFSETHSNQAPLPYLLHRGQKPIHGDHIGWERIEIHINYRLFKYPHAEGDYQLHQTEKRVQANQRQKITACCKWSVLLWLESLQLAASTPGEIVLRTEEVPLPHRLWWSSPLALKEGVYWLWILHKWASKLYVHNARKWPSLYLKGSKDSNASSWTSEKYHARDLLLGGSHSRQQGQAWAHQVSERKNLQQPQSSFLHLPEQRRNRSL